MRISKKNKEEIYRPYIYHSLGQVYLKVKDFFRTSNGLISENIYHHIGIYAFTNDALTKYVRFPRSKLEKERDLEQMRAMENNMIIKVALSDSVPLGVDTEESLKKVSEEMKKI